MKPRTDRTEQDTDTMGLHRPRATLALRALDFFQKTAGRYGLMGRGWFNTDTMMVFAALKLRGHVTNHITHRVDQQIHSQVLTWVEKLSPVFIYRHLTKHLLRQPIASNSQDSLPRSTTGKPAKPAASSRTRRADSPRRELPAAPQLSFLKHLSYTSKHASMLSQHSMHLQTLSLGEEQIQSDRNASVLQVNRAVATTDLAAPSPQVLEFQRPIRPEAESRVSSRGSIEEASVTKTLLRPRSFQPLVWEQSRPFGRQPTLEREETTRVERKAHTLKLRTTTEYQSAPTEVHYREDAPALIYARKVSHSPAVSGAETEAAQSQLTSHSDKKATSPMTLSANATASSDQSVSAEVEKRLSAPEIRRVADVVTKMIEQRIFVERERRGLA